MGAGLVNFEVEQGARFERTLNWKDSDGVLVPLTGYTAELTVREPVSGAVLLTLSTANGRITLTSPGVIKLVISAADTALLTFDSAPYVLNMTPSTGSAFTMRLLEGMFTIDKVA